MARTDQEAIETFISITGASEAVAIEMLEEHGGDLNAAVNAHFTEGDRNTTRSRSAVVPVDDAMDIDDPIEAESNRAAFALLPASRTTNAFSLLDPNFRRSFFDGVSDFTTSEPLVTHPREVREVPIEVKDSTEPSRRSGHAPAIEDVSETAQEHRPTNSNEAVIIDEVDEDSTVLPNQQNNISRHHVTPSAPVFDNFPEPEFGNDIEEQMIRAAIEASKWDVEDLSHPGPPTNPSRVGEDAQLAEAVSLSLKAVEQEKALHEQGSSVGTSESVASKPAEVQPTNLATSNGRLMRGSSSIQDDAEDVEEQPLVRHRSKQASSSLGESVKEIGVVEASPPSSPGRQDIVNLRNNGNAFPDEWGGISSEEHDEAVMLEAAMFGGIPESGYRFPYAPHQFIRPEGSNPWRAPRPPSPSLEAQRLIREQQDDEYYASLQADREKEMKAIEEAEARRLKEEATRKAALEEEQRKEEELRRKVEEEQECERLLAAKEASLPQEPAANEENVVNLLVRMPDGSRRGRRFLKSDRLKSLYDFIDIGRGVKPGTYRLVRPYPRRAFGDGESSLTLNELGLASKQEALFLELI